VGSFVLVFGLVVTNGDTSNNTYPDIISITQLFDNSTGSKIKSADTGLNGKKSAI
jgi:hypothetical protein